MVICKESGLLLLRIIENYASGRIAFCTSHSTQGIILPQQFQQPQKGENNGLLKVDDFFGRQMDQIPAFSFLIHQLH